jgi:hypothetical protein
MTGLRCGFWGYLRARGGGGARRDASDAALDGGDWLAAVPAGRAGALRQGANGHLGHGNPLGDDYDGGGRAPVVERATWRNRGRVGL